MRIPILFFMITGFILQSQTNASPYVQLNKNYNRISSRVMIRSIPVPTLANLDYAAYTSNPVRFDPQKQTPKQPAKKVGLTDLTFSGAISNQCDSISQTPLTNEEKNNPMAWDPLQNKIWEIAKTDEFAKVISKINSEKWADHSIFIPYQEVVAVYLHKTGDSTELWAKIEFKPWVKFLTGITDEDKDGFCEIYGKLNCNAIDKALYTKVTDWMQSDYCKTILTNDQIVDWANLLASYWYPKLNTDVVDMTGQTKWPTPETEKDIIKELKGFTVDNPVVVIRGTPYGKKLFNVYYVPNTDSTLVKKDITPVAASKASPVINVIDSTLAKNFIENNTRFLQEVKTFGTYQDWAKKDEPLRQAALSFINKLSAAQMGFIGKDNWLFFRGEILYMNGGDMSLQAANKNPIPHLAAFNVFLKSKNISLLFVAVPNKSDVYFDKLPVDVAVKDPYAIINPYGRKILKDIQDAGVETIDLLPAFLEAKKDDAKNAEALYQKHDTHWTTRGISIAANLIANRIKTYSWYPGLAKNAYTSTDTSFSRQGDIVDKLAEADKTAFTAVTLAAQQVHNPDGSLFKGNNPDSPIMLIGDSFTGVFELIDCKAAGVGAHIAANTQVPVDITTSWGGGPLVRDKWYRARKNVLDKKRVVIYMMVARDLFNYSQLWQELEIK